jgi:medium-chain acyl-[acyl-carrier-protein] hydrolase
MLHFSLGVLMTDNQSWYVKYRKNSNAFIRLFCFHHSGGGASSYYPWVDHLSPNIEIVAVQLPGRENRFTEPLSNNIKDIVSNLCQEFSSFIDKPFFVFGHSLGALISFEFVKSIHQSYSLYPCFMVISAAKAPQLPFRMRTLSKLDDKALKEELRIYNGIDELILSNDELLDLFLPIIRNDFSISENYHYIESKPFPFDIFALSGIDDQTTSQEEILAWDQHTKGKFEHTSFSGKHFYIKEHQRQILEIINQLGERYSQKMD